MIARGLLVLALLAGGAALAGCTDPGVVGEVMPLSTPATTCDSDMDCGDDERCNEEHACVACDDDECESDPGCGRRDGACPECAGKADCTSDALPFCVEQMCVACREDDDCEDAKCEHGACVPEADDEDEHQDDGAAGASDDNSGPGSMSDGEAGEPGSDDGP
jgi:hypothetical protein